MRPKRTYQPWLRFASHRSTGINLKFLSTWRFPAHDLYVLQIDKSEALAAQAARSSLPVPLPLPRALPQLQRTRVYELRNRMATAQGRGGSPQPKAELDNRLKTLRHPPVRVVCVGWRRGHRQSLAHMPETVSRNSNRGKKNRTLNNHLFLAKAPKRPPTSRARACSPRFA
jgi:hypothetical protein